MNEYIDELIVKVLADNFNIIHNKSEKRWGV